MTDRLILLDVDGVLNPLRGASGFTLHHIQVRDNTYPVRLNPEHGPMLRAFAEEVGAELVWATTWEGAANTMIAPLIGLSELRVMKLPTNPTREVFNEKFASAPAFCGDADWVWFEDVVYSADTKWLKTHPGLGRFRVVQVSSHTGLSEKHLKQARRFFKELDKDAAT
jgi:hypothetical protein